MSTAASVVGVGTPSFDAAMTDATAFFARSLSSFLGTTLAELSGITSPDIASSQFLSTYAAGSGIAMFVLVVTLARLFYRTSAGEMSGQALAHSLWGWAPGAMMLVLFGPALGQLTVQLIDAATESIVTYFGSDLGSLPDRLASMVVIDDPGELPGGPIVALLIMAVAFVGVGGLVGGLVMQTLVLYLTGAVMAIAFVAMIDPATRGRAARLPSTWLGLLLAKPLLFFLIGAFARISGPSVEADAQGWELLMPALLGALALLFVGLAPWSLVRATLPQPRSDRSARGRRADSVGASGGSSTMMQLSYRRMHGYVARQASVGVAPTAPAAQPERSRAAVFRPGVTRHDATARDRGRDDGPAGREQAVDATSLAAFGEQAIDNAPPATPVLVRHGEPR
ncbi:hypothetical protein ACI2K4_00595 [Micromonospora sp. NPDC050397]|uniref:hypothetical protein n=1 Tax=Micromonospora sp. NPDC050397 TaxID=3364279 RepID=UPI00384FFC7A